MKTFEKCAAQGDTYFRRVDSIPADAEEVKSVGRVVIAHSETGHDHVIKDPTGVTLYKTPDPFTCYLRCETAATLEHLREFDTHEAIMFPPGLYQVRRQREHTPAGYRMVAD